MKKLFQPFHLVTVSPWPILTSGSLFMLLFSSMYWFNNFNKNYFLMSMLILSMCLIQWWRDIIRESTYQGFHTLKVIKGLKLGMILFIISELFFFISIFWCFLHMFLSPSIEIGMTYWPPKNIISFNPYQIPLINTIILLSSGITITWSHYSILNSKKNSMLLSMYLTIILAILFTYIQYYEYNHAMFTISDSVFGSIFFMSTGFHGLHVIIGTLFLIVNMIRMHKNNFSSLHHFGFEAAAWYWHFVDMVWMFLYLLIYFQSY